MNPNWCSNTLEILKEKYLSISISPSKHHQDILDEKTKHIQRSIPEIAPNQSTKTTDDLIQALNYSDNPNHIEMINPDGHLVNQHGDMYTVLLYIHYTLCIMWINVICKYVNIYIYIYIHMHYYCSKVYILYMYII